MSGPMFQYDGVELNWLILVMCMLTAHWVMSRINIIWQKDLRRVRSQTRSSTRRVRVDADAYARVRSDAR